VMLRLRGEFGGDPDQDTHASLLAAVAARDSETAAGLSRTHLLSLKALLT